ncbi:MAG: lipoyl synthase [Desulfamplus sp.]|nr:lipoyl synthase [Desulfamplus sp.]
MKPTTKTRQPKPAWLKRSLPTGTDYERVRKLLGRSNLHTVCQEAKCPNMWECFSKRTSTFMIMGDKCTRNCSFCNVKTGNPLPLDSDEPLRVARAAFELGLKYVVITSVTRDDLDDGGAHHFSMTIKKIKELLPHGTKVEVLIPDFQGDSDALNRVMEAQPDVLNHNIETVPSLYATVRPEAIYKRSLELLRRASQYKVSVKSGIMVGFGETKDELEETIIDLYKHGCTILTVGQYLQPSAKYLPVVKYYEPQEFDELKIFAESVGFTSVASAPFVRSSYEADRLCGL